MKISIAMATYNGAAHLRAQLRSFLAQTRAPDELVICDDGSSDDTIMILNQFASTAPFEVRIVVNKVKLGYVRNFEQALLLCNGDLIFLSDQDDVWLDNKIEEIIEYMKEHPSCLVVTNDQIIADANLVPSATIMANLRSAGWTQWENIFGCATAIRNLWLNVALPIPDTMEFGHDAWICGLADFVGVRHIYDRPLQYYRRHGTNCTNFIFNKGKMTLFERFAVDWKEHGFNDARAGWRRECDKLHVFHSRLSEQADEIDGLGVQGARLAALERIATRRDSFERRISLLSKSRWDRMFEVISFWRAGGYRNFLGWKSAVKDLLR